MSSPLARVWPLFGLVLRVGALELRLPDDSDLAELAQLAGRGVHHPHERPFLTPWTDGSPADRERFVVQQHWRELAGWTPDAWRLGLGVVRDGRPVGLVTLRGRGFAVAREVTTSSWVGLEHQGQGVGMLARVALLALAFDRLGAHAAVSEVFQDNAASQRVSRRLGYVEDGISRDVRGDEVLVSDRLRLTAARWVQRPPPVVEVDGLTPCLSLFGVPADRPG